MDGGMKTALFLSDDAWQLLANVEAHVYETECANHCVNFEEGVFPGEHSCFRASRSGHLVCDAYRAEAVVA